MSGTVMQSPASSVMQPESPDREDEVQMGDSTFCSPLWTKEGDVSGG